MKKKTYRALSLFMSFVLLIGIATIPLTVNATGMVQLTVSSATGVQNQDVVVSIDISANSGLAGTTFLLQYDNTKLAFKSRVPGVAAAGGMSNINASYSTVGHFTTIADSFYKTNTVTAGGSMLNVTFTILPGWDGTSPVTLTIKDEEFVTVDPITPDSIPIDYFINNGGVTVPVAFTEIITFDGNGGNSGSTLSVAYGETPTAPTVTRKGYTFDGWSPAVVPVTGAATYKAQWTINQYSVTFDSAGGTVVDTITQDYNTSVVTPTPPTKTGYTFAGWLPAVPTTMPATTTNCVAQWTNITWVANGGIGSTTTLVAVGTMPTAPIVTRVGYTFASWLPAIVAVTGAATYTAQWTPITYNVTFNANNGTGTMSAQGIPYQTAAGLNKNTTITRTGYTFAGWNTVANGTGTAYANQASYTMSSQGVTLYAQWTQNYTITFNANGGIGGTTPSVAYGTMPTAPIVTRAGYTFASWSPAIVDVTGTTTYTAIWTPINYTITFDTNGGIGGTTPSVAYGTMPTAPIVTKIGYTFASWSPTITTVSGEKTYLAQWTPINYTITFDANGGIGGTTPSVAYDTMPTAPTVTREGYKFDGWLPAVAPVTGTATYTAQWSITTGYIYTFGSYPQTKVTDTALISALNLQTLQADSTATYNGSKYLKQTDWFKFEPIQWRVLSNTNDELFVMADKILDTKAYNQDNANVTWETCTMRNWLNNDFYNTAFNPEEQSRIETSTVVNADNPWYGTEGGNNTGDKLLLLSYSEVMNTAYGFSSSESTFDPARRTQGTDFSKSNGLHVSGSPYFGNSHWWLRSPGDIPDNAGVVGTDGYVYISNNDVSHAAYFGARPAFKINLKSEIFTSFPNSSCVVDYDKMTICGLTTGATSLAGYVNVASGYELSYVPTSNGFCTGTIANVTKDGETVQRYTIVIYGDVNGDGNIDSIDAGTIVDVENDVIPWDPTTDAAYFEAGDLNGDGNVDSMDAGIAVDIENDILFINQSTGTVSVITPIAGTVVITGLPKYGNTLTADTTNITPAGATFTYVWKRSGVVVGTEKNYVVTANDIGKSIVVSVTGFGGFSGGVRSAVVVVTPAIISGTVTATGTAKFDEVLTANTSNIDPIAATLTYQWKRGAVNIGSENTYTIVVEDIGQPITVTVTGTGVYEGNITSAVVSPTKADVSAPLAPKLNTKTVNSVTLIAVAGQEYKIEGGAWQASLVFAGLNKNTAYNFYTRVAETATHNASASSTALSVTTNKATLTGTVAITGNPKAGVTLSVNTAGVLPSGATLSYSWKIGSEIIGTNSTYTALDIDIGESVTVTVTGTGDYMGSLTSAAVVITE